MAVGYKPSPFTEKEFKMLLDQLKQEYINFTHNKKNWNYNKTKSAFVERNLLN